MLVCSCVFSPFSIAITSLAGERANFSAFFVRLFDLSLFVFVCFLFLMVSGTGDFGTPWTFLLPFLQCMT